MNNKGYTLIELVVGMFVTTIVVTIVISFLITNSRSYSYASEETDLQMESQTVMNQLFDMMLEANWVECQNIDANTKALVIYHSTVCDVVFLDKLNSQLYYIPNLSTGAVTSLASIAYAEDENLMGKYVSDVSLYPDSKEELLNQKKITLTVTFQNNSKEFNVARNVKFRNELVSP